MKLGGKFSAVADLLEDTQTVRCFSLLGSQSSSVWQRSEKNAKERMHTPGWEGGRGYLLTGFVKLMNVKDLGKPRSVPLHADVKALVQRCLRQSIFTCTTTAGFRVSIHCGNIKPFAL